MTTLAGIRAHSAERSHTWRSVPRGLAGRDRLCALAQGCAPAAQSQASAQEAQDAKAEEQPGGEHQPAQTGWDLPAEIAVDRLEERLRRDAPRLAAVRAQPEAPVGSSLSASLKPLPCGPSRIY